MLDRHSPALAAGGCDTAPDRRARPCPYSQVRAADDHDARLGRTRPRRARRAPAKHLAMPPVRVAVDAMGGDRAPEEVVAGAVEAASDEVEPVLYGRRESLEPLGGGLPIVHAD